jgi:adenylate cyclase
VSARRGQARDFITKPFGIGEVLMRIQNLLEVRLLQMEVRRQNAELMARSCDTPS